MENTQETAEKPYAEVISEDRLKSLSESEWGLGRNLRIQGSILAQDKWQEMLDASQKDGLERGLTVAFDGKNIFTSKVATGTRDSILPEFSPRGIRSVFSRKEKNLVSLHTHPMPPELDHIQTVPVSDKDVNLFINSVFKTVVTIDRGGIHMLAKTPYSAVSNLQEEPTHEIAEKALKIASQKGNTAMEVMQEMAKKLRPLGIRYYYSPKLNADADGFVELTDVLK